MKSKYMQKFLEGLLEGLIQFVVVFFVAYKVFGDPWKAGLTCLALEALEGR